MAAARAPRHRWLVALTAFGVPVAFLFSLAAVVVAALSERVLIGSRAEQASVAFGRPLVWVRQDQTSLDPTFPSTTTLSSPWEHPVHVSGVAFLLDLMMVAVVVLVVAALVVTLRRRVRQRLRGGRGKNIDVRAAYSG